MARIDDIDVSDPFERELEPLEGPEAVEDMVVLVNSSAQMLWTRSQCQQYRGV